MGGALQWRRLKRGCGAAIGKCATSVTIVSISWLARGSCARDIRAVLSDWRVRVTLFSQDVQDDRLAARVRAVLKDVGRVHVPGVLVEAAAKALYRDMLEADWRLVFRGQSDVYEIKPEDFDALPETNRADVIRMVHGRASTGFQYFHDVYRISDKYESGERRNGALAEAFAALNSPPVLDTLRRLTGDERIAYVDARATRFRDAHFLTTHDDEEPGKHRLYAYVLNLTPQWSVDWGGLLMFLAGDGHVSEAFTPCWNALNILKVPQPHAVSMVAPFARAPRYSITGWMRSRAP